MLADPSYVIEAQVSFLGGDSALMIVGSGVNRLRLDADGKIVSGMLASGAEVVRVSPR